MKSIKNIGMAFALAILLSACAYKINVLQGNFLEQTSVDKLRVAMSYEQVIFVLGKPVISDAFKQDTWYYIYEVRYGNGDSKRKELILTFKDGLLVDFTGDYTKAEEFNQPLSI